MNNPVIGSRWCRAEQFGYKVIAITNTGSRPSTSSSNPKDGRGV